MTKIHSWTRIIGLSILITLFLAVSAFAFPDPEHWYRFENNNQDSGTNPITLSILGPTDTPTYNTTLPVNGTYSANVSKSGFFAQTGGGWETSNTAFTLSVWMRNTTAFGTQNPTVFLQETGGTNNQIEFSLLKSGGPTRPHDIFFGKGIGASTQFMFTPVPAWVSDGDWIHVVLSGTQNANLSVYIDGQLANTSTTSGTWGSPSDAVGVGGIRGMAGTGFGGQLDEVMFWDQELTAAQVLEVFQTFMPSADVPELTITATDIFDGGALVNLSAIVTNGTVTLTNNTLGQTMLIAGVAQEGFYTVNLSTNDSGGYFNVIDNVTINFSTSFAPEMFQNYVIINATELFTDASTGFINATVGGIQTIISNNGYDAFLLPSGTHEVIGRAFGEYFETRKNVTVTALQNVTFKLDFYNALANVTLGNADTGEQVPVDFELNITPTNASESIFVNGTAGLATFVPLLRTYTYDFRIMPEELFTNTSSIITVNNTYSNLTVFSDVINSISLTVRHEPTNKIFGQAGAPNETVTFEFYGESAGTLFLNLTSSNGSLTTVLPAGDYELRYSADSFDKRSYFFNLSETNALSSDIYLLDKNLSALILVTVIDQDENQIQNAIVKVLRQYVDENGAFKVVEMVKTDQIGQNPINIVPNTQDYQFLIEVNDRVVFRSPTNQKVVSDTISFKVDLVIDLFDEILGLEQVQESLTFNNNTGTFTLTYSDTTGNTQEACLIVTQNSLGNPIQSYRCVNSSASTLQFTIPDNSSSYTAISRYQGVEGSRTIGSVVQLVDDAAQEIFGTFGLALGMFFILGLILTGVFAPQQMIMVSAVGLIVLAFSGLLSIPSSIITGVAVVGLIIIYISNRGVR